DHYRIKQALRFRPPSEVQNEIRNDYPWLDAVILRTLELDPARRFADGGRLREALELCAGGGELPPHEVAEPSPATDELFREVRLLLGKRAYGQVIDRLDIHR